MISRSPVSVSVPTHNGESFIAETLDSNLGQTAPPTEIIVVNDGSTDGGRGRGKSYGEPVRVMHQEHSGVAAARNRGVAAATQPYLAFLDHDDLWTSRKLEVQLAALASQPELAGVFGYMSEFLSPDVPPHVAARLVPQVEPQPSTLINCLLARAEEFRRVGPLDVDSHAVSSIVSARARPRVALRRPYASRGAQARTRPQPVADRHAGEARLLEAHQGVARPSARGR